MRELTQTEVSEVAGGWVRSIVGGVIGTSIWDGIGGWEGVESLAETVGDGLQSQADKQIQNVLDNPDTHGLID